MHKELQKVLKVLITLKFQIKKIVLIVQTKAVPTNIRTERDFTLLESNPSFSSIKHRVIVFKRTIMSYQDEDYSVNKNAVPKGGNLISHEFYIPWIIYIKGDVTRCGHLFRYEH